MELEFHSKIFKELEFQNRNISLYSFKIETYCQIFKKIRAKAHFLLEIKYKLQQMKIMDTKNCDLLSQLDSFFLFFSFKEFDQGKLK